MQENAIELSGLFISAFISATIAPGGSEAILAYMVSAAQHPVGQLIIVATLGNTLGAMTTWSLGGITAKRFPATELLPEKRQKVLSFVKKRGIWTLFFSWLPILGDALCFAGGWLGLPLLPACLAILLGKLGRYMAIAWLFA